jgi:hypothetical protein
MITVSILINGNPIMARSAVNKGPQKGMNKKFCRYEVDDGSDVYHNPDDGAVKLAIKLLKTICESE